jgi:hypothetical protein
MTAEESESMWTFQTGVQLGVAAMLTLWINAGCHHATWREQAPRDELTASEIRPQDLGIDEVGPTRVAANAGTEITFPTGLAVVRLSAAFENTGGQRLLLASSRADQQAYWNQLFNDLPALREVVVLTSNGLNPDGFAQKDVFRRAILQNCSLCLIYARISGADCDSPAEFAATLWNAQESKLVASWQVPIDVDVDEQISDLDDRAETQLRGYVREAVWTLAKKHEPSLDTRTSPWGTNGPLVPRGGDKYRYIERLQERRPRTDSAN